MLSEENATDLIYHLALYLKYILVFKPLLKPKITHNFFNQVFLNIHFVQIFTLIIATLTHQN